MHEHLQKFQYLIKWVRKYTHMKNIMLQKFIFNWTIGLDVKGGTINNQHSNLYPGLDEINILTFVFKNVILNFPIYVLLMNVTLTWYWYKYISLKNISGN